LFLCDTCCPMEKIILGAIHSQGGKFIWDEKKKFYTIFGKFYKGKKQLSRAKEKIKENLWGAWWVSKGNELGQDS